MNRRTAAIDARIAVRRAAMWVLTWAVWSCSASTTTDAVASGDVASIEVTPPTSSLAIGAQLPLTAIARGVDGKIVSDATIIWSVKDAGIASVSPSGVVTGVALGSTQVAASANGKSGIAVITVQKTPIASLVVRPNHVDAAPGTHTQLTAIAYDGGNNILSGRAVIWTSSNVAVATVDASGTITAVAPGTATITGTAEGKSDAATVTVSQGAVATVSVSPNPVTITAGQSSQLTATPRDANGNLVVGRPVTWSSANTAVATVSDSGLVKAMAGGTTTITATVDGKSGTAAITVNNVPVSSVVVQPSSATITKDANVQFSATVKDANGTVVTDRTVTWTSSNQAVAIVNSSGLVTGMGAGTATITATSEGISGTATVTVTTVPVASVIVSPSTASITVGQSTTLTATVEDANGNVLTGRTVTWSSSNTSVATVSSTGVVTGLAGGTATITATSEGKSGTSAITVTAAPVGSVTVTPSSTSVFVGKTVQLTAVVKDTSGTIVTDRPVTWTSSNTSVATVDGTGLVTGVAVGTVTITAKSETKSGTASVTVSLAPVASVTIQPSADTILQNQTVTFTAVLKDADGNVLTGRTITWSSSNTSVATINSSGTATGGAPGTTTITATSEGKSGTASLLVNPAPVAAVIVSPASASIGKGHTVQLTATAKDASGKTLAGRTFTWTSSDNNIATVSSSGLVTGVNNGIVTITATCDGSGGAFGTSIITVGK